MLLRSIFYNIRLAYIIGDIWTLNYSIIIIVVVVVVVIVVITITILIIV